MGAIVLGLAHSNANADETWTYSVEISATAQVSPPQITLHWENDDIYGVTNFTIYRKGKNGTSWNYLTSLDGSTFSWSDPNVSVGATYEYQIFKGAAGHVGYGYIYSGINASLIENRGKLLLMVATNGLDSLSNELARLQSDIIGDGWQVIRHDVSSNDTPASVKSLIVSDYNADPPNVQAVFLFGHVPILQSGFLDYDTHGARPMPADCYYADMDGDWSSSPSYLPSDVELMVARVDLANMPGNAAPGVFTNEVELLRNYLNKDHRWRHKLFAVPRRALMADRFGDLGGEARSTTGYGNFAPMVGPSNTLLANVSDASLPTNCWLSLLSSNSYLWTYACGGGQDASMSAIGVHGQYYDAWSTDIVGQDAKASMNDSTLYRSQSNDFARAIYIELLGDPTLRLEPVAPPANFSAAANGLSVALNWSPSIDSVTGYHIYRATSSAGTFTRLTSSLITGTTFTDLGVPAGSYTYMIRGVALQTNPSGSYYNPSQGVFASVSVSANLAPISLTASRVANGIKLTWNSQPGTVYRVLAKTNSSQLNWADLSGSITAASATTSWSDNNVGSVPNRFYRIASP